MKRFRLKRRIVTNGTLNSRAMKMADTSPIPLPAEGDKPAPKIAPAPKNTREEPKSSAPSLLDRLNPKQVAFIEHYMASGNATDAAIKAGYAKSRAQQTGSMLVLNGVIAGEIRARKQIVLERGELRLEDWLVEQRAVAFANMGDYMRPGADGEPMLDFRGLTRAQTAALREVTVEEFVDGRSDKRRVRRVKFRLHDKNQALDAIGKHFGWLSDKSTVDHNHKHSGAIGLLLDEIDKAGRAKLIDVTPQGE
jgi:phage terminase small subunit